MFNQLAMWIGMAGTASSDPRTAALTLPTHQLERFLEEVWLAGQFRSPIGANGTGVGLPWPQTRFWPNFALQTGSGPQRSGLGDVGGLLSSLVANSFYPLSPFPAAAAQWHHLIYAYMIENTRIFEIIARILWELRHGERLQVPAVSGAQQWLDNTEYLLFNLGGAVGGPSQIRPDGRALRRNLYYRMFGMELTHGAERGGAAYPFVKPAAANRGFSFVLEELLREVWRGIENTRNTSGPNPTDDEALANLARELQEMLIARRGQPDRTFVSREEFNAVAAMDWLLLTVDYSSPIIQHLVANAPSAAERTRLLGERVGLPAHARSIDYFELATALSPVLILLERGYYSSAAGAQLLYGIGSTTRPLMETVISRWSMASGRDLKSRRVSASIRTARGWQNLGSPPATQRRAAPPPATSRATANVGSAVVGVPQ